MIISVCHNPNQNKVQTCRGASNVGDAQMFQTARIRCYSYSAANKGRDVPEVKETFKIFMRGIRPESASLGCYLNF